MQLYEEDSVRYRRIPSSIYMETEKTVGMQKKVLGANFSNSLSIYGKIEYSSILSVAVSVVW